MLERLLHVMSPRVLTRPKVLPHLLQLLLLLLGDTDRTLAKEAEKALLVNPQAVPPGFFTIHHVELKRVFGRKVSDEWV